MEMLSHAQAKVEMQRAGLRPAVSASNPDIALLAGPKSKVREVTWASFFNLLDERKLGVFMDPATGYMKIMGQRNQRLPERQNNDPVHA